MNKYILILANFMAFLPNSHQLISMNSFNQEQQLLLNKRLLEAIQTRDRDNEQLLEAAKAGDKDTVISLLDQGADVNHTDNTGKTALMNACAKGHQKIARILIKHGADVNHADRCRMTALLDAGWNGYGEIVRLLIEQGAHVNHAGQLGKTVLIATVENGYIEIVRMLIEHGAHVNHIDDKGKTPLIWAAEYVDTDLAIMLARYGARILSTTSADDKNLVTRILSKKNKISPLILAIITRDREHIIRLLDGDNNTIFSGPYRINHQDKFGMTALHWAVAQNYGILVEDLLNEYNPNLAIQDNEGNTVLHHAARNGNEVILEALLAYNAHINTPNGQGDTALHTAIQHNRASMVQALLGAQADHIIRNKKNRTPLDVAREHRRTAIIDVLSRERIIPGILRDRELFQHLHAQGRNVPDIGMPEEIIAHIVHFLSNPNSSS